MRASWNWGLGITLVYVAFAGSTLGVVGYAMTQPVDLVSEDYYGRSLRQDERSAAIARADALGTRAGVEALTEGRGLDVRVPSEMATSATGTITWYRPSDSHDDRVVPLRPGSDGHQHVLFAGLLPGHWILQVEWQAAGESFYLERAVVVP